MTNDKLTGSFYTPHNLVNYMVDYVSKRICPRTILEPAAGDGRFISPLFKFNVPITAVELEEEKAKDLRKKWGDLCTIVDGDFLKFSLEHETKFDLIIGNPPYITKKMMIKEQCDRSFNLVNQFSLNASLFQNMWVSFLLASIKLLSPTGAIFFVLPFEFLQVQYAEKLRIFLEKKFNTIEITTFEDRVFTDIEQDVCLVYFSNEESAKPFIRYTTLKNDTNTTETFSSIIMRNKPLKKWSNCILNDEETEALQKIALKYPQIGSVGDISPGIVTGANNFFIRSEKNIEKFGLNSSNALPILMKSSAVPPLLLFTKKDFLSITAKEIPTYVLNLKTLQRSEFSLALSAHIKYGKKKEIHTRYKCKSRKRWFDVPIVENGAVCFFKRFHILPRVIVNQADVHTTDISYNIRFYSSYKASSFAFCFYNSLTLALCEYNGRFYGGGVGELTPSEFKALHIPYKDISDEKVLVLDKMIRAQEDIQKIVSYVDSIVLFDLPEESVKMLQAIRTRYISRRMKTIAKAQNENN